MADFSRAPQRFFFTGIAASPADALGQGKLPYCLNTRSYEDGTIGPRDGFTAQTNTVGTAIHSISRLNDSTPFNGGVSAVRVVGATNGNLYRAPIGTATLSSLDSGYSGLPFTFVASQPPQSPRPYLYVADSQRMRKFATDGNALQIGLSQPQALATAPNVALGQIASKKLTFSSLANSGSSATPINDATRVATGVSLILYDSGSTGYCSIVPTVMTNITEGMLLLVGAETVIVTELTIAVASTTVAAIIYDAGTSGLCTIQPAGSLGLGQLEAPSLAAYAKRAQLGSLTASFATPPGAVSTDVPIDSTAPIRRIRQVDFPVNSLILLGGALTRILSVAVGPDGIMSFRCSTAGTVSVGATIVGKPAVRVYTTSTHTAGQAITNLVKQNTLKYPLLPTTTDASATTITSVTGGVQAPAVTNFAQFSDGTAVLPDDIFHLAVKVDRLTEVTSIRLFFALIDNDFLANAFLENYYVYEWRASDISASIQSVNAATVTPLATSRATVVTNQQLNPAFTTGHTPAYVAQSTHTQVNTPPQDIAAIQAATQGTSAADAATTTQLALGNNQWMDLQVRVRDLIRVGTDNSKTLADVKGFQVLVSGSAVGRVGNVSIQPPPLTVNYGDVFVAGGSGPDVGEVGDPYVYAYRYRSSLTGAVSNPSPHSLGGVIPKRQKVLLTPTASSDPQVDKIDWFRLGGALVKYTYLGTGANSSAVYEDTVTDASIDGGEALTYDNFQPWATQDLPTTTVVNVSGTAIHRVSGDVFNASWATGSAVIVNGRAATLYASPTNSDILHVNESIPFGSSVAFVTPGATKLSQPLQAIWGDFQGTYFACGDADNPGTLYFTHGNNIEAARDSDTLQVTSPSEPLQSGFVYNTFAGVFSTQDLYQIIPNNTEGIRFRVLKTPCGRGLWTPWAYAIGPEGIFFLGPDGIYITAGGSPAISVTDADLRAIFPNDGMPGSSVNGIPAPDMSQRTLLRLTYVAGYLYFDYFSQTGTYQTLMLDIERKAWQLDTSAHTHILTRYADPGSLVFDQILAGSDGLTYQFLAGQMSDAGTAISWEVDTQAVDGGQPRVTKQFGDAAVSLDAKGSTVGIIVHPVTNDGTLLAPTTIGLGDTGRDTYIIELPAGGYVARNMGLVIQGATVDADPSQPLLYLWEPSFLLKADSIARRATDWDNLGYQGAKFVQGIVLTANTYGQDKVIVIQRDASNPNITLTINHDGEVTKEYPSASQSLPGWPPFIAHQVRIVGSDDVEWQFLGYRFVWEPHPELASQWETQFTSHDLPGYMTVRDCVIAHASEGDIRLRIIYDDGDTEYYTIPASGGTEPENYTRSYVVTKARKGKAVQYQLRAGCPFRLFKRDCSVRVGQWGSQGGYQQAMPFGGPHRADGAAI